MSGALDGVAKLTEQLVELGKLSGPALRSACRAGIKVTYDEAIATVPVGIRPFRLSKTYGSQLVTPTFLRRSIKIGTKMQLSEGKAAAFVGVKKQAFYGVLFVELGTRKMGAEPWLRPALINKRTEVEAAFKASLQRQVIKAIKLQGTDGE